MKPETQERLRDRRDNKADWLRVARQTFPHKHRKTLKRWADTEFGKPPRIKPETLGDYWPCEVRKQWEGTETLVSHLCDDDGFWITKIYIPEVLDDEEISHIFGSSLAYFDGGPGRRFQSSPCIERSNHSTFIISMGGMDI